jgi:energy-converting hydrogenase Eha subunit C
VAVVETARLSTTVNEEGSMVTDLACAFRNSQQQYLDLSLPKEARIWHVFVNNERVTALEDAGKTKIPVARKDGREGGVGEVRLRYSHKLGELGRLGSVMLESPLKDIDVMRLGWTLSLPEGYDIIRDSGNIKRVEGTYAMEGKLQELQPDAEVQVQVQARPSAIQGKSRQWDNNAQALDRNLSPAQGGPGATVSVYTGAKPQEASVFTFQSLILSKGERAWVQVQYVKGSLGIPLKVGFVVVVLGLCALVWGICPGPRLTPALVLYGSGLVALAARTLGEGAYYDYLTIVMATAIVAATAVVVYAVARRVQERRRREREQLAELAARRAHKVAERPAAPPPAEPQPPAKAEDEPPTGGQGQ